MRHSTRHKHNLWSGLNSSNSTLRAQTFLDTGLFLSCNGGFEQILSNPKPIGICHKCWHRGGPNNSWVELASWSHWWNLAIFKSKCGKCWTNCDWVFVQADCNCPFYQSLLWHSNKVSQSIQFDHCCCWNNFKPNDIPGTTKNEIKQRVIISDENVELLWLTVFICFNVDDRPTVHFMGLRNRIH